MLTYSTLDSKNDFFLDNIIINSKNDFLNFYNNSKSASCIFRGINEAKYKIFTSIQRAFIEGKICQNETTSSFLQKQIEHLKKNNDKKDSTLVNYWNSLGVPITDYLCLSYLQHYSAPTTFIDFSHDIDVALYFAATAVKYATKSKYGHQQIEDYISLYWLDTNDLHGIIPDIIHLYIENYINRWKTSKKSIIESNQKSKSEIVSEIKNYLYWISPFNNDSVWINNIPLGYISNKLLYEKHVDYNTISGSLTYTKRLLKKNPNDDETVFNRVEEISGKYLSTNIQLSNLNIVAQKGCFIHYNASDDVSLEECLSNLNCKIIHCVNIHKSLVPFILDKIKLTNEDVFPDNIQIAQNAKIKTIIQHP